MRNPPIFTQILPAGPVFTDSPVSPSCKFCCPKATSPSNVQLAAGHPTGSQEAAGRPTVRVAVKKSRNNAGGNAHATTTTKEMAQKALFCHGSKNARVPVGGPSRLEKGELSRTINEKRPKWQSAIWALSHLFINQRDENPLPADDSFRATQVLSTGTTQPVLFGDDEPAFRRLPSRPHCY